MSDQLFKARHNLRRFLRLPLNLYGLWRLPKLRPGDVYLDCANHPVVCTESDLVTQSGSWFGPWDYDLAGVSLLDGSHPRSCSAKHCAPRKVSYEFAVLWVASKSERHEALENIRRIYEQSPELQRVWS